LPEPKRENLEVHAKRAVLAAVLEPSPFLDKERALDEIQGLAETAGARVVGKMVQVRETPDPGTYMGRGKLEELRALTESTGADLILFDNMLSPAQGKNVEEETGKQVVDRSEVILDIFATDARSHEETAG
jgi:GTP-binding protein HflX